VSKKETLSLGRNVRTSLEVRNYTRGPGPTRLLGLIGCRADLPRRVVSTQMPGRVLIVEGDPDIRTVMSEGLEGGGLRNRPRPSSTEVTPLDHLQRRVGDAQRQVEKGGVGAHCEAPALRRRAMDGLDAECGQTSV
jgi:hypothetical protein